MLFRAATSKALLLISAVAVLALLPHQAHAYDGTYHRMLTDGETSTRPSTSPSGSPSDSSKPSLSSTPSSEPSSPPSDALCQPEADYHCATNVNEPPDPNRVLICHMAPHNVSVTTCILRNDLPPHLLYGDTCGACPNETSASAPPTFCCTWNYKDCEGDEWCSANVGNCAGACNGFWLEKDRVPTNCIALWGECTDDIDGCCTPSVCDGNQG